MFQNGTWLKMKLNHKSQKLIKNDYYFNIIILVTIFNKLVIKNLNTWIQRFWGG